MVSTVLKVSEYLDQYGNIVVASRGHVTRTYLNKYCRCIQLFGFPIYLTRQND